MPTKDELDELQRHYAAAIARAERAEDRADRAEAALRRSAERSPPVLLQAAADELEQTERLMRAVFTRSTDGILLIDDEGRYVDANPAALEMFGVKRSVLLRSGVGDFNADPSEAREIFRGLRESGVGRGRVQVRRDGGEVRTVDFAATTNLRAGLHLAVMRDVTDEQRAKEALARSQEELQRSEARFRALVEHSAEAFALFGLDGRLQFITGHAEALVGYSPAELVGRPMMDMVDLDDQPMVAAAFATIDTDRSLPAVEFRARHRRGETRWIQAVGKNLFDDPHVGAFVVNLRDVTARHEAEQERERLIANLQFERGRLGTLLERAPSFILVLRGEELVVELANDAFQQLVGRTHLVGRRIADAIPEAVTQGLIAIAEEVFTTGIPYRMPRLPIHLVRTAGREPELRYVTALVQPLTEPDGTRTGIFVHGVDVTEQTIAEERVRAQFNAVPVPVYAWQRFRTPAGDADFRLLDYNDAASKLSNGQIASFMGHPITDVLPSSDEVVRDLRRCLDTGETFQREGDRPTIIGEVRSLLMTYAAAPPDVVLLHAEDVTERRRLEGQLRQAQKMEAVGRLAGGIAHDFNNLLTIILSYTQLIRGDLRKEDPMAADLAEVEMAANRAVDLTKQLLAFSRQQVLQPRILRLDETVRAVEKMLRRVLHASVELVLELDSTFEVEADPGQIEQVILNLVINAGDAMQEGGRLTLATSDVELEETLDGDDMPVAKGSYVRLCVGDTGSGMDAATRAKIFEPFFTTKGPSKGTGLGLATVFGIVKQSRGAIRVRSELGKGSAFEVYLPRAQGTRPRAPEPVPVPPSRGHFDGTKTILVVEDDTSVRALITSVLRREGYRVLEAGDGEAALALVQSQRGEPISLVLTDVVMPKMNGRALVDALARKYPNLRAIFMSGYTDDDSVLQSVFESRADFLQKPMTPAALLQKVAEVLRPRA